MTVGAGDGVFDSKDAQYANLRVWRDLNQDGMSQGDELFTLTELNIASLDYETSPLSQYRLTRLCV